MAEIVNIGAQETPMFKPFDIFLRTFTRASLEEKASPEESFRVNNVYQIFDTRVGGFLLGYFLSITQSLRLA